MEGRKNCLQRRSCTRFKGRSKIHIVYLFDVYVKQRIDFLPFMEGHYGDYLFIPKIKEFQYWICV